MAFCANCGNQLDDSFKACPYCGTLVAQVQPEAQPEYAQAPQAEAQPEYVQPEYTQAPQYEAPAYQQPQYTQPQYGYQQPYAEPERQSDTLGKIMSIVGMICGILSIVFCWVFGGFYMILPIAGLVTSIIGGNRYSNGMATAGKITSIIGIVLCSIFAVIFIVGCIGAGGMYYYF